MILMAGGTGAVGRLVVQQLREHGDPVRIITRNPDGQKSLRDQGAECVKGDLRYPEELRESLKGVKKLLISVHSFLNAWRSKPQLVDELGVMRLIDLAREAGVEHVVYISVAHFTDNHSIDVFHIKSKVEKYLMASKMDYTILRPNCFIEAWGDIIGKSIQKKGRTVIVGSGEVKINFISVRDVAKMIVKVFHNPSFRNQVIDLAGPENLTMKEVAVRYGEATGKPYKIRHVPLWMFRTATLFAVPFAPGFILRMRNIFTYLNQVDQSMDPALSIEKYGEKVTALDEIFRSSS